ncbi:hypothetical protein EZV62_007178 [Acer yangbiense]|uniref:Disease resistance protein At4g27190-like leucine-rich repeats domain-containing protein n=1 Tax=Acer yangbiense TaxID=1000413 RepID=A0A5C7I8K4_9ROSI|nr:hypothetical protein EZV62_007178 [Acer yangbiense]
MLCRSACMLEDIAIIGDLERLEILSISYCDIERLPEEIGRLTRLRLLDLSNCLKLRVIPPNIISSLTQLEALYTGTKQPVSRVVAFPLLESFILKNLINLEKICSGGGLISDSFCKLRIIKVKICDKLKKVLCLYIARGLVKLERFEIIECKNVEEIFATEREDDDRIHFSQLRYMTLRSLPQLKSFCSFEKSQKKLLAADTRTREIISEDELDITTPLFNKQCRVLEEIIIVTDEELREEERKDYVTLPRLTYLKIEDLKNLKRLYSGNYIEIPSLKQLVIGKCLKMKPFIFDDKVAFPSSEKIRIFDMDNLETIWHSRLAEHSYCKLKSMEVKDCRKLLTVFPSNVCIRFLGLESLKVRNCSSVLEIFDLRRLNFEETHSIVATQLREVYIFNLSKLEHLWNKDPQGMLSFQELLVMKVTYCESLKNVFLASVARSLSKLEKLEITRCNGVKEIVAKEGVEEAAARFLFPQVTSLMLTYLPELRTFYPGIHSSEWPVLPSLELSGCNKVEIFTSEFLSFHEMSNDEEGQLDISVPQPLFMVKLYAESSTEDSTGPSMQALV